MIIVVTAAAAAAVEMRFAVRFVVRRNAIIIM